MCVCTDEPKTAKGLIGEMPESTVCIMTYEIVESSRSSSISSMDRFSSSLLAQIDSMPSGAIEHTIDRLAEIASLRERLLPTLQTLFSGYDARVFGSSVKKIPGAFVPDAVPYQAFEYAAKCESVYHQHTIRELGALCREPEPYAKGWRKFRPNNGTINLQATELSTWRSDVDVAIIVPDEIFALWADEVYDGTVGQYADSEARNKRLEATFSMLGLDEGMLTDAGYAKDIIDPFLYPESFVSGRMQIPAWEQKPRSFRDEVLSVWMPINGLTTAEDSASSELLAALLGYSDEITLPTDEYHKPFRQEPELLREPVAAYR